MKSRRNLFGQPNAEPVPHKFDDSSACDKFISIGIVYDTLLRLSERFNQTLLRNALGCPVFSKYRVAHSSIFLIAYDVWLDEWGLESTNLSSRT